MNYISRNIQNFQAQANSNNGEIDLIVDTSSFDNLSATGGDSNSLLYFFLFLILILGIIYSYFNRQRKDVNDGPDNSWNGNGDQQPDADFIN